MKARNKDRVREWCLACGMERSPHVDGPCALCGRAELCPNCRIDCEPWRHERRPCNVREGDATCLKCGRNWTGLCPACPYDVTCVECDVCERVYPESVEEQRCSVCGEERKGLR